MKHLLVLSTMLILSACGKKSDYVYYDNPAPIRTAQNSYPIISLSEKKVDVLFVIDNSGSMSGIQNNIVNNSALFMNEFKKDRFVDWKIGLISTDKSEAPRLGFQTIFDSSHKDPVPEFQGAVRSLGTNGDAWEYVLYNVFRMKNDMNYKNFFRKDAHLAVIMVTDEEEQSIDNSIFGPELASVNTFLNYMKSTMGQERILRFYGALALKDLPPCTYSDSVDIYNPSPFKGVIESTGGKVISACDQNFGQGLAEIGKDIVSLSSTPYILLTDRPYLETLEVTYKGKSLKGGPKHLGGLWYYDEFFSKIVFYDLKFVPDGDLADIKVKYDIDDGRPRS